ncbi:MAG TPA: hypothetical protein GXZ28_10540 [Clostridiales bacterium]|nr:hypothetical protein [Clostridiales bacterium]
MDNKSIRTCMLDKEESLKFKNKTFQVSRKDTYNSSRSIKHREYKVGAKGSDTISNEEFICKIYEKIDEKANVVRQDFKEDIGEIRVDINCIRQDIKETNHKIESSAEKTAQKISDSNKEINLKIDKFIESYEKKFSENIKEITGKIEKLSESTELKMNESKKELSSKIDAIVSEYTQERKERRKFRIQILITIIFGILSFITSVASILVNIFK